jgi:polyhydroxyalkanoate synthesis regulator phasin
MAAEEKGGVRDGMRQGLGVLSAFKEAVEETINEARERGDLSSDRAREIMKDALDRAQQAADGARERLDLVPRKEFDDLVARVRRLEALAGVDPLVSPGESEKADEGASGEADAASSAGDDGEDPSPEG